MTQMTNIKFWDVEYVEGDSDLEYQQRNKIIQEWEDFAFGDSFFADEKKKKQKNTHHKLKLVAKKIVSAVWVRKASITKYHTAYLNAIWRT